MMNEPFIRLLIFATFILLNRLSSRWLWKLLLKESASVKKNFKASGNQAIVMHNIGFVCNSENSPKQTRFTIYINSALSFACFIFRLLFSFSFPSRSTNIIFILQFFCCTNNRIIRHTIFILHKALGLTDIHKAYVKFLVYFPLAISFLFPLHIAWIFLFLKRKKASEPIKSVPKPLNLIQIISRLCTGAKRCGVRA